MARRPYFFVAPAAFATLENLVALPARETFGLLRPSWWHAPHPQPLAHAGPVTRTQDFLAIATHRRHGREENSGENSGTVPEEPVSDVTHDGRGSDHGQFSGEPQGNDGMSEELHPQIHQGRGSGAVITMKVPHAC
ncbi:hypothetical protein [Streptomyces sp. NPDC050564]|uniref:hypothetical protein n=1 Tax=Streptomyces sp. NPDC050564 TaxID=3365631 RepID=UPI0037B8565A